MIIGQDQLKELVEKNQLVSGLCERELNNPEGAGFDLRLGEIYALSGPGFLGREERSTPAIKLLARYEENARESENFFIFQPGGYYLVKTLEKVNLPVTITGLIFPRTTLFRSGLGMFNGLVQPGYAGELTFGLANLGQSEIKISLAARVAHITFHEIAGAGRQYRGQWQGGRVGTNGAETKV